MALVLVVAAILRLGVFHTYAENWDPAEYVWAVQDRYLPHSPYLLYLWAGIVVAGLLPPDVALTAINFVSGLVSVGLLGLLVRRQVGHDIAGIVAAGCLAVFPSCVWYSGIQEVYAFQCMPILAAMLLASTAGVRPAAWGGLALGAALASHNATIFVFPAFLLALWTADPERRRARLGAAAIGVALLPLAVYGWCAVLFARSAPQGWAAAWLAYVRGIAPGVRLEVLEPTSVGQGLASVIDGTLRATTGSGLLALVLAPATLVLALVRSRFAFGFWLAYLAPFACYEIAVGENLDPGIYVVFTAPALAALLGVGLAALPGRTAARRGPRWLARAALAALVWALVASPLTHSWRMAERVTSRAAFLERDGIRALRWIGRNTPRQTHVLGPRSEPNTNLIPVYSGRKPIVFALGQFRYMSGGSWAQLNLRSFPPLTDDALNALLESGATIVAFEPEPTFTRGSSRRWRREWMREEGWTRPLFVLEKEP